jgi:phosphomannomutase
MKTTMPGASGASVKPPTLRDLSERRGVRFGTSGLRGLVPALTPDVSNAFTHAFLNMCNNSTGAVLIGHDLRPSSPAIAGACFAEARRMGFAPVNAGILPTPALAFAAQSRGVPAIMVTGSHITFDRNGIKFYFPQGEISKEDEERILSSPMPLVAPVQAVLPTADGGVADAYVERYRQAFGPACLAGLTLGIYEHSSAARDLLHTILRALGATTVGLLRSEGFVPVDTEAVSEEDRALGRTLARHSFDAILTTDGDADRPLIADEHGEWLRGDAVGVLAARALGAQSVVTPVSSGTALERCGWFAKTIRTRIGSPHVIAGMGSATRTPVVGYEANGGFLLGSDITRNGRHLSALKTRDAVLPMILLLDLARKQGMSLSALAASLPARHTFSARLQEIDIEACRTLLGELANGPQAFSRLGFPATALDLTDGVRASLSTGDMLHLRLSGNAPELRCYAEADTAERATALCGDGLAAVEAFLRT